MVNEDFNTFDLSDVNEDIKDKVKDFLGLSDEKKKAREEKKKAKEEEKNAKDEEEKKRKQRLDDTEHLDDDGLDGESDLSKVKGDGRDNNTNNDDDDDDDYDNDNNDDDDDYDTNGNKKKSSKKSKSSKRSKSSVDETRSRVAQTKAEFGRVVEGFNEEIDELESQINGVISRKFSGSRWIKHYWDKKRLKLNEELRKMHRDLFGKVSDNDKEKENEKLVDETTKESKDELAEMNKELEKQRQEFALKEWEGLQKMDLYGDKSTFKGADYDKEFYKIYAFLNRFPGLTKIETEDKKGKKIETDLKVSEYLVGSHKKYVESYDNKTNESSSLTNYEQYKKLFEDGNIHNDEEKSDASVINDALKKLKDNDKEDEFFDICKENGLMFLFVNLFPKSEKVEDAYDVLTTPNMDLFDHIQGNFYIGYDPERCKTEKAKTLVEDINKLREEKGLDSKTEYMHDTNRAESKDFMEELKELMSIHTAAKLKKFVEDNANRNESFIKPMLYDFVEYMKESLPFLFEDEKDGKEEKTEHQSQTVADFEKRMAESKDDEERDKIFEEMLDYYREHKDKDDFIKTGDYNEEYALLGVMNKAGDVEYLRSTFNKAKDEGYAQAFRFYELYVALCFDDLKKDVVDTLLDMAINEGVNAQELDMLIESRRKGQKAKEKTRAEREAREAERKKQSDAAKNRGNENDGGDNNDAEKTEKTENSSDDDVEQSTKEIEKEIDAPKADAIDFDEIINADEDGDGSYDTFYKPKEKLRNMCKFYKSVLKRGVSNDTISDTLRKDIDDKIKKSFPKVLDRYKDDVYKALKDADKDELKVRAKQFASIIKNYKDELISLDSLMPDKVWSFVANVVSKVTWELVKDEDGNVSEDGCKTFKDALDKYDVDGGIFDVENENNLLDKKVVKAYKKSLKGESTTDGFEKFTDGIKKLIDVGKIKGASTLSHLRTLFKKVRIPEESKEDADEITDILDKEFHETMGVDKKAKVDESLLCNTNFYDFINEDAHWEKFCDDNEEILKGLVGADGKPLSINDIKSMKSELDDIDEEEAEKLNTIVSFADNFEFKDEEEFVSKYIYGTDPTADNFDNMILVMPSEKAIESKDNPTYLIMFAKYLYDKQNGNGDAYKKAEELTKKIFGEDATKHSKNVKYLKYTDTMKSLSPDDYKDKKHIDAILSDAEPNETYDKGEFFYIEADINAVDADGNETKKSAVEAAMEKIKDAKEKGADNIEQLEDATETRINKENELKEPIVTTK